MHDGLERLAQLNDDELDALIELAQMQSGGVSRRDALKGAGAVGLGALVGGGATGAASAQASETDNDPNVGSSSNRVDVFSDGVDANVVNTDFIDTGALPVDYHLYEDSGTFRAAGPSGLIDSGTVFDDVANAMLSNIPSASNRSHYVTISIGTESWAEFDTTLTPPGQSVINLSGGYKPVADVDFMSITESHTAVGGGGFINGDSANRTGGSAFVVDGAKKVWVENLRIGEWAESGVKGINNAGEVWVQNCDIAVCDYGVYADSMVDSFFVNNDIGNCVNGYRLFAGNNQIHGGNVFLCNLGVAIYGNNTTAGGWLRVNNSESNGIEAKNGSHVGIGPVRVYENGQDGSNSNDNRSGVYIDGVTRGWVGPILAYDEESNPTQQYGVYRTSSDYIGYDGVVNDGNANAGIGGTKGANSQDGIIIG